VTDRKNVEARPDTIGAGSPVVIQILDVVPAGRRNGRCVTVICPYCARRHVHGWPEDDSAAPGLRQSHCQDGGQPYFIAAPGEASTK
jgi:hypothetical protein